MQEFFLGSGGLFGLLHSLVDEVVPGSGPCYAVGNALLQASLPPCRQVTGACGKPAAVRCIKLSACLGEWPCCAVDSAPLQVSVHNKACAVLLRLAHLHLAVLLLCYPPRAVASESVVHCLFPEGLHASVALCSRATQVIKPYAFPAGRHHLSCDKTKPAHWQR